jgi:hypothetical protein
VGAPFLARSLREKWGFSTERSQRVRPAEQSEASIANGKQNREFRPETRLEKIRRANEIVQCRERAALKRRVKRGEKRGFRVRVTTRNSGGGTIGVLS